MYALSFNQPQYLSGIEALNHHVGGAHERERMGNAPAIGMEQRNRMQLHAVGFRMEGQADVQGVEVDVSVGQHHPLWIGAGSAVDRKSTRLNSSHVRISY